MALVCDYYILDVTLSDSRFSSPTATVTPLQVDPIDSPDLTKTIDRGRRRIIGHGYFSTVYRCLCSRNGEVSVCVTLTLSSGFTRPVVRLPLRLFASLIKRIGMSSCERVANNFLSQFSLTFGMILEDETRA